MSDSERRRYPRHGTEVGATIFANNQEISATLIDIGVGGIGVISEKAIYPSTEVYIAFKYIDDYSIHGIVRWSYLFHRDNKTYYRMGIEAESIVIQSDNDAVETPDRSEFGKKVLFETIKLQDIIKSYNRRG